MKLTTWCRSTIDLADYPWWDRPRMLYLWARGWVGSWLDGGV